MDRKQFGKHGKPSSADRGHRASASDRNSAARAQPPPPPQADRNLAELFAAHNLLQSNPLALLQQQMSMMAQAQQAQANPAAFFGQNNNPYQNPTAAWLYLDYISRMQSAQQQQQQQQQPPARPAGPGSSSEGQSNRDSGPRHFSPHQSNQQPRSSVPTSTSGGASSSNRPSSASIRDRRSSSNSSTGIRQPPNKKLKLPADTEIFTMNPKDAPAIPVPLPPSKNKVSQLSKTLLPPSGLSSTKPSTSLLNSLTSTSTSAASFSSRKNAETSLKNHLPQESPPSVQILKLGGAEESPLNLTSRSGNSAARPKTLTKKALPPAPHPMLKEKDYITKPAAISPSAAAAAANNVTIIPHAHTKPDNLTVPPGTISKNELKPAHEIKSHLYSHVIPNRPQLGMVVKPSNAVSSDKNKKKTTVASLLAQSRVQDKGRSQSPDANHDVRSSPTPHRPWMNTSPSAATQLVIPTVKKPQQLPPPSGRHPRQHKQQAQRLIQQQLNELEHGHFSREQSLTPPLVGLTSRKNQRSSSNASSENAENLAAPPPTQPTPASPADLAHPLNSGWKRETLLKGLGAQGLSGEVVYISPNGARCKQMSDVKKHLTSGLTVKMFSFSSRLLIGDFILPTNTGNDENATLKLSANQLANWLSSEGEENRKEEARQKEERERKKQHTLLMKNLEVYRRIRRKQKIQIEKRLKRKAEMEQEAAQNKTKVQSDDIFAEVDELTNAEEDLPELEKVNGMRLSNQAFANLLQAYEFLHTFGETLGFDMESLPSMSSLQKAFLHVDENEEELLSVMSHLLVCAVEDPGMSNPNKHITAFGQTLKQADITFGSLSELLKLYLEGIADSEPEAGTIAEWLEEATFLALTPTRKSTILAFLCDLLLQNKAVLRHLDSSTEAAHNAKKERQQNDVKVRRLRMLCARKAVAAASTEASEKAEAARLASESPTKVVTTENGDQEDQDTKELKSEPGPEDTEAESKPAAEVEVKPVEGKEEAEKSAIEEPPNSPSAPETPASAIPPVPSTPIPTATEDTIEFDDQLEEAESDPDARLSVDEIRMKMNQLNNVNEKLRKQIIGHLRAIRSNCLGQDRWRRRFWNLPNSGGIYVEGGSTSEFPDFKDSVREVLKSVPQNKILKEASEDSSEEEESSTTKAERKEIGPSENEEHVDSKEASEELSVTPAPAENEVKTEVEAEQEDVKPEPAVKPESQEVAPEEQALQVPPPVIKIFSFEPRTGCSGKVIQLIEPIIEPESDDELFLRFIKEHPNVWEGWWMLSEEEREPFLEKLCSKGIREKLLRNTLTACQISEAEDLDDEDIPDDVPSPEQGWDPDLSYKVHLQLLEGVETLEERVGSASLQVKGWTIPTVKPENPTEADIIELVKERLLDLESAVERRYLKPPLGKSEKDISLSNLTELTSPDNNKEKIESYTESRALTNWRDGVAKAKTPGTLSMALYSLDSSIAWDKSVMKASCQLCKGGDNEDKLLLCDACDRGYHTYCFKPPMDQIPDGDWFCYECINKATGIKACIVCGKQGAAAGKLLTCDKCVKAYHTDCLNPPVVKVPRGRWHCPDHSSPSKAKKRKSESNDKAPDAEKPTKQQKSNQKKAKTEASWCEKALEELAGHEDAWPFLDPVNTRQFPTYKKVIKNPMDLATIRSKLPSYKSKDMFLQDVRLIFANCETFNEDDSPVGKAGHSLRVFFESKFMNCK